MNQTIAITAKWQIHIPKAARRLLGLKKPGVVSLRVEPGKLIIAPKKSGILSLGGSLHKYYQKKPIDIDNIRDHIDYSQA